MKRREVLSSWAGALFLLPFARVCQSADPQARPSDPWVGTYVKYAVYDPHRSGHFGEAVKITITRDRDGYSLGKPYADRRFREVEKGVLSDGPSGLGRVHLGAAEYADGVKIPILRAEFCYEQFLLYRVDFGSPKKSALPKSE
jgi:hypothetical protein